MTSDFDFKVKNNVFDAQLLVGQSCVAPFKCKNDKSSERGIDGYSEQLLAISRRDLQVISQHQFPYIPLRDLT
ncbi:predicted protein [Sclerotinia sclerotiorum 1980 UF-70]|uniref:Uncharacterized protein n=1 Tax=Sclerotinia sclerotiorum (strain ATCC 18683 / 1980 / Ss-1) TaxID=665079 RepID=A7F4Q5_SCLS1|nr:predicted protein [Sclerotinia sclerotiorum 1980 UF-70]EDN97726.1 predicted protein [Sclerotinia sclerotiorum 1980 UF-70]